MSELKMLIQMDLWPDSGESLFLCSYDLGEMGKPAAKADSVIIFTSDLAPVTVRVAMQIMK